MHRAPTRQNDDSGYVFMLFSEPFAASSSLLPVPRFPQRQSRGAPGAVWRLRRRRSMSSDAPRAEVASIATAGEPVRRASSLVHDLRTRQAAIAG
jgi:hypothetical protein